MTQEGHPHDQKLYEFADKALKDLVWIAPEDVEMRRTKIYLQIAKATMPLREIHDCLDGREWNSGTLDEVASILRRAGFAVKEPE